MPTRLPLLVLVLVALPVAAQQQVYRWVDADGKVTFSSTPPPAGKTAEAVELPPTPSAEAVEAARQREQALQQLGDRLSQERREREARRTEAQRTTREEAVEPQPVPPAEPVERWTSGWWIPGQPDFHRPRPRPPWPERPMPPGPRRDPTAPPDHPAFWPRQPVLPPALRPEPWPVPPPSRR